MKVPPPSSNASPGRGSSTKQGASSFPKSVAVLLALFVVFLLAGVLYTLRKQPARGEETDGVAAAQPTSANVGQLASPVQGKLPEPQPVPPEPSPPAVPEAAATSLPPSDGPVAEAAPDASPPPGVHRQILASNAMRVVPEANEQHKLRQERRELDTALLDLARRLETEPLARLDFPLFDGQQVHLVDIKHTAKDSTAGVFFAKVEGEAQGGHAILAYAKNALAGSIHLPSKGLYFLVHNAAPQGEAPNQSFLIQLDPTKMPKCGTCDPNNAVHLTPVSAQPKP